MTNNVESPCVKKCKIVDQVCTGCKRTLMEISNWSTMSNSEKEVVLNNIKERE